MPGGRPPKFKPDELVVAKHPTAIEAEGRQYVFNPKDKIRGDHPAVLSNPRLFKRATGDD